MAKLDANSGPLHDTIQYLVQHHVAVTSTLPVFEMISFSGRPTVQKELGWKLSLRTRDYGLSEVARLTQRDLIDRICQQSTT